jgi:tyrosine-protein phosphatase non-receptor type 23
LKAITNAYAAYAPIRKIISETAYKRHSHVNALIQSSSLYNQLQEKAADGLTFYAKLRENVSKVSAKVVAACKVQEEERQQYYDKTGKRPPDKTPAKPVTNGLPTPTPLPPETSNAPKLKDFLAQKKLMSGNAPTTNEASSYTPSAANAQHVNGGVYYKPEPYSGEGARAPTSVNPRPYYKPPEQVYGGESVAAPTSVVDQGTKATATTTAMYTQYGYHYPYYTPAGATYHPAS